jgi:hypothetical protein
MASVPYSGRTMWASSSTNQSAVQGTARHVGTLSSSTEVATKEHRCLYSQCECTEFGRLVDVTDPAAVAVEPSGVLSPR